MKRAAEPNACAVTGCDVPIRRGMLMCRAHWFATPKPLREAITDTWARRREDGLGPWSTNVLEARKFHFQNSPAALADRITGDQA
ncbi:hypothetical protein [Sphingomonas sp. PR090111-T3T-6A]|uniref:hypothetical protein n=1 Tax=Sphingomonas sp. PR090111-T3T-6A TaxID=685778 RepID=UPI00037705E0|nr:hypothetical protein [Sphingomonas sp. PR090111-T3T-6A]